MATARSRVLVLPTFYRAARIAMRPGSPGLGMRLAALPRMFRSALSGRYQGLTLSRLGLMAAAVAYIVSPLDLIPEAALLMFGTVDDALVLSWLAAAFVTETESYLAWEDGAVVVPEDGPLPATVPSSSTEAHRPGSVVHRR